MINVYKIRLSDKEVSHLAWLTDRGYFPDLTYDKMHLADGEPEFDRQDTQAGEIERTWEIPEFAAWAIVELRDEDPYALFNCTGGVLLDKLLVLEESIV